MGIKRRLFFEVGGFDEHILVLEDVDLCWRIEEQGIPLTFVPDAIVHVRTRHGLASTFVQARNYARSDILLKAQHGAPVRLPFGQHFRSQVLHHIRGFLGIRSRKQLFNWVWRFGWFVGTLGGLWSVQNGETTIRNNGHHQGPVMSRTRVAVPSFEETTG